MLTRYCAVVLLLTFLAACGGRPAPAADEPAASPRTSADLTDTPTASTTDRTSPSPTSGSAEPGTRIVVSDSGFGPMLYDGTGQAIYLFDVETTSRSRCYDTCAEAWPPVLTTGDPVAGPGVERSMLGTTERADGTVQVTYNGHPLYFYAHEGPGEVRCHDVFLNGGNWYVVRPGGDAAPPG